MQDDKTKIDQTESEVKVDLRVSLLAGRYWHELTDEEMQILFDAKVNIGWVVENIKQPDWCEYPNALKGAMGCWSLVDVNNLRKKISHEFCKDCDCYRKSNQLLINPQSKRGVKNMEFTRYYGRYKQRNNLCTQNLVSQNKTHILKFRVDDELLKKIENKCDEKGKDFSKLNRILWEAYFEVGKNLAWKKEVDEMCRPKLKLVK